MAYPRFSPLTTKKAANLRWRPNRTGTDVPFPVSSRRSLYQRLKSSATARSQITQLYPIAASASFRISPMPAYAALLSGTESADSSHLRYARAGNGITSHLIPHLRHGRGIRQRFPSVFKDAPRWVGGVAFHELGDAVLRLLVEGFVAPVYELLAGIGVGL